MKPTVDTQTFMQDPVSLQTMADVIKDCYFFQQGPGVYNATDEDAGKERVEFTFHLNIPEGPPQGWESLERASVWTGFAQAARYAARICDPDREWAFSCTQDTFACKSCFSIVAVDTVKRDERLLREHRHSACRATCIALRHCVRPRLSNIQDLACLLAKELWFLRDHEAWGNPPCVLAAAPAPASVPVVEALLEAARTTAAPIVDAPHAIRYHDDEGRKRRKT